jgi:DNA-binding response OmpR family regulator
MDPNPPLILVLEDHTVTRHFLADNLLADGFEPLPAAGLAEAEALLARRCPALILLDLGLPDGDGLEFVRRLRGADPLATVDPELPLLVLSGRSSELDRLRGFERGCDDYVTKPFSYQELRARIRALLRRSRHRRATGRLRAGPLELEPFTRVARLYGEPVALSKKEYALLRVLASDPERVFTREELLRTVWGFPALTPTRTLDSHAFRLRQKLNRGPAKFVVNVWGVGYRLMDGGGR